MLGRLLMELRMVVLDYHEWREGLLRGLAAHQTRGCCRSSVTPSRNCSPSDW